MKKNLLTLGLLAIAFNVNAQVLTHIGDTGTFFVGDGALVYNGGGLQTINTGKLDIAGNVMIDGKSGDVLKTLTAGGSEKVDGGNILLRLNDPVNYATSTYGQLYVTGIAQADIKGIVDKQYKDLLQGSFQQMAVPFAGKTMASLATQLGRTSNFSSGRNTNAAAFWHNTKTVMRVASPTGSTYSETAAALYGPTTYFAIGTTGWNPTPAGTGVLTLKGRPYADQVGTQVVLQNGGKPGGTPINYGPTGGNLNEFNEKYRTYLNDPFDTRWTATYGKELYQYGNPFFTNIDLSWIGTSNEGSALTTDGNKLPVQGIRFSQSGVQYSGATGTTTSTNNIITFNYNATNGGAIAVGDVNSLVVKPMTAIYIKLNPILIATDATFNRNLNFNTLRRFKNTARILDTNYSVSALRSSDSSTLKQLGVIALDSNGNELSRTYYVVAGNLTTGYTTNYNVQANLGYNSDNTPANSPIYTNEEFINGGADPTYVNQYRLYINEANENDFLHKKIPLTVNANVAQVKFEIRENAALIADNQNALSSGESFWIRVNGVDTQISQNQVMGISQGDLGLYYGTPEATQSLTVNDVKGSSTVVVFDKDISEFFAVFDKNWKKADIQIFDLSGKLINTEKDIDTDSMHKLSVPKDVKNAFLIVITSDKGDVYKSKIMR